MRFGGNHHNKLYRARWHRIEQAPTKGSPNDEPGPMSLPDPVGTARTQCWCRHKYLDVSLDEIRAGRTISCGRPGCVTPSA